MFDHATDFLTVKRFSTLDVSDYSPSSAPFDHLRIRVYELSNNGAETLIFTSDPFVLGSGPESFTLADVNDVGSNQIGVSNSEFYRIDVVEFDVGETVENVIDEMFMYTYPDVILTQTAAPGALDSEKFEKLLAMLGHNVLHGELQAPAGYTQQRITRYYGSDMTETEAQALLLTSEDPEDINVEFKSRIVLTVSDNGNELKSREVEIPV